MSTAAISTATLNRTSLRRQHLLERTHGGAFAVINRLTGLQAQNVDAPYIGLWSRVEGFAIDDLVRLLHDRVVARGKLFRDTQHLIAADDYRWARPLVHDTLVRGARAAFGKQIADLDLAELAEAGREALADDTLTRPQLRDLLAQRFPDRDAMALAWVTQAVLPIVHPAPSGVWRRGGAVPQTLASRWLGRELEPPDARRLVTRYLAGFGPASVADMRAWSGVRGLAEVVDGLDLRRYRGPDGTELYDLPEAELTPEDTPAPVRLLPMFDNLMVGYADRTRIMSDRDRATVCVGAMIHPTVLVDGRVAGIWNLRRDTDTATVTVDAFAPLASTVVAELTAEARRLLAFATPESEKTEVIVNPG